MKPLWINTDCTFGPELRPGTDEPIYRYTLTRYFPQTEGRFGRVAFVLFNPSTADHLKDDPTVRRCVGYSYDWGFAALEILNGLAYRETFPVKMKGMPMSTLIGPENDRYIEEKVAACDLVVCGWGSHRLMRDRQFEVLDLIRSAGKTPMALKVTAKGVPHHPLYLKADLKPFEMAVPQRVVKRRAA